MTFDAGQIGRDIVVFLTVSGGFIAQISDINEVITSVVLLAGLLYTCVRIIGQIKTNKGKELDNKIKQKQLDDE